MSKWELTAEALSDLLAWLDPDPELAARQYQIIHRGLVKIFTSKGCHDAEELADETINRVACKAAALAKGYEGRPANYFYGVARNIYLEYQRKKVNLVPLPTHLPEPAAPEASDEAEFDCLELCAGRLAPTEREIVWRYYAVGAGAAQREALAERFGYKSNALRVKVFRIVSGLEKCMNECLRRRGRK